MKNRTLSGDEETRRLIRNTIHNYSSDDWEERLNAVKSSSKYSGSFYSKDILLLMLLAAEKGRKLKLIADGPQENEVLDALKKLIEVDKFNEE